MEFRVFFTIAKYENGRSMKTICFRHLRHSLRLLMLFVIQKFHFYHSEPFKLIKTMLKSLHNVLGLSPVWNCYPKSSHTKGATKHSIITFDYIKYSFAMNKFLNTIWSTETNLITLTYPAREHYIKNA